MKVFISWSGDVSGKVARILRDWLPYVIPTIQPFVSAEDIEKGKGWGREIASQLDTADFGILCVTRHNVKSPWLNFEAGALSRTVKSDSPSRVSPFLFGIGPGELSGPLQQFQATTYDKDDIFRLVSSLNDTGGNPVNPSRMGEVFNTWWPKLYEQLEQVHKLIKKRVVWAFETAELNAEPEIKKAGDEGFNVSRRWIVGKDEPPSPKECDLLVYVFGKSDESKENLGRIVDFVKHIETHVPLVIYTRYALGDGRLEPDEFALVQSHGKSQLSNMPETLVRCLQKAV